MKELINTLGGSFRGLWRSEEIQKDNTIRKGWSVTFVFNNCMVETPYFKTPEEALTYAIFKIKYYENL